MKPSDQSLELSETAKQLRNAYKTVLAASAFKFNSVIKLFVLFCFYKAFNISV